MGIIRTYLQVKIAKSNREFHRISIVNFRNHQSKEEGYLSKTIVSLTRASYHNNNSSN